MPPVGDGEGVGESCSVGEGVGVGEAVGVAVTASTSVRRAAGLPAGAPRVSTTCCKRMAASSRLPAATSVRARLYWVLMSAWRVERA